MNLTTTYLGLNLRSAVVPSSSPLGREIDNLRWMEDAGAGAVVLPSFFEENLRREGGADPDAYLELIRTAKERLSIPVIGSINGTSFGGWTTFSREIEQAGADALELNLYAVPTNPDLCADEIEHQYLCIVAAVKSQVRIPVAVKLSPFFTNLGHFARRVVQHRADGLVLFNRFYQPDIDLESSTLMSDLRLSTSEALRLPLRWMAILHGRVACSLAATSGVHRGADVIKAIMAGADVAMVCSVLLKQGIDHLGTIEREVREWMEQHSYDSLEQIRGQMSHQAVTDPSAFERAHYVHGIESSPTPVITPLAMA